VKIQTACILLLLVIAGTAYTKSMVGGDAFFHYQYEDSGDNEFLFKRAYLTVSNKVNDNVSYKFQADIGSGGPTAYSLYLKNANIALTTDFGKLTLGMQGMNMFKVQENTWGYRFISKMPMDLAKFSSSADLGIRWDQKIGGLSANVMITNGSGYKRKESDKYKKISASTTLGQTKLKRGFNAGAVVSHEGYDYADATSGETSMGSSLVVGGFGGTVVGALRIGAEYSLKTTSDNVDVTASAFSVYANYMVNKNLSVFGRHDILDDGSTSSQLSILGANYMHEKVLSIAPNILIGADDNQDPKMTYRLSFRFNI